MNARIIQQMRTYDAAVKQLVGLLVMLLALSTAACREGELESEAEARTMPEGDESVMQPDDVRMVGVSVTRSGSMMPILPAGRATFTVENEGAQDCVLKLTPHSGDGEMEGALGSDDQMGADPTSPTDPEAETPNDAPADGSADPESPYASQDDVDDVDDGRTEGSVSGLPENRVAAGEEAMVTLDLQPGTYEVSCENASGDAYAASGGRMLVSVTDEHEMTGGARPDVEADQRDESSRL